MTEVIRPPDDVYWYFRRLPRHQQVGAECLSHEDGYLYRVGADRIIYRVVNGKEIPTIDSIPLHLPAAAKVLTGAGWGFHLPISTFYQEVIATSNRQAKKTP